MTKEEHLIDLLRQIKEVLDGHNVEFWLECGTLLGAVREGKFLRWEHDLDFGAWSEKVSKETKASLAASLIDRGLKVWIAENHINIKAKEEIFADINFYHIEGDTAVMPALYPKNLFWRFIVFWQITLLAPYHSNAENAKSSINYFAAKSTINLARIMPSSLRKTLARMISAIYKKAGSKDTSWIVPKSYLSELSTIKFYEMEFKVPARKEDYLAYRYGEDWRVPKEDYVGLSEDKSFLINRVQESAHPRH